MWCISTTSLMSASFRMNIHVCHCCVSLAVFLITMMTRALTKQSMWSILRDCRLLTSASRSLSRASIRKSCQPSSQHNHSCPKLFSAKLFARCLSSGPVASPADLRSPVPDVEIPNISFAEFICGRCDEFKDRIALVSVSGHSQMLPKMPFSLQQ